MVTFFFNLPSLYLGLFFFRLFFSLFEPFLFRASDALVAPPFPTPPPRPPRQRRVGRVGGISRRRVRSRADRRRPSPLPVGRNPSPFPPPSPSPNRLRGSGVATPPLPRWLRVRFRILLLASPLRLGAWMLEFYEWVECSCPLPFVRPPTFSSRTSDAACVMTLDDNFFFSFARFKL